MRTKVMFPGIKNSQKIRVIVDSVGFYTTVAEIPQICTTKHFVAVESALKSLSKGITEGQEITGFGTNVPSLKVGGEEIDIVSVQVDLV